MRKRYTYSTLKNAQQERALFQRRVLVITILMGLFALLLIARLGYLQLYQHRFYKTLARQNQFNLLPIAPDRGLIYDRNGVLLADNIPTYELVITPSRVTDLTETIKNLSTVIAINQDDLRQFNRQLKLHRPFQPVPLRTRLTEEEVARFSTEAYHFPGVTIQTVMIRHYPFGAAFASVVGLVGRINIHELSTLDPVNYSVTNFIGKTGIEKYYEAILHGKVGYQEEETAADGEVVRVTKRTPPTSGNNLYLTIDSRLQIAAVQALGTQRGAIVAIQPQTGEVLALVSSPGFDPNLFADGISQEDYDALQNAPSRPLYNRALQGRFPAGSTFKPFIALEGLDTGTVTPTYSIFDPGWFKLPDSSHIYHDMLRTGHGSVDMNKAIPVSCDTYFYNLANKLGIARIDTILQHFGFGQKTGIDLPGEANGLVPTPEWKQRTQGKSWYPGDTLITGIGQGFTLVTPLQLAFGAATLADHGARWLPHVLLRSEAPNHTFTVTQPTALTPVQVSNAAWKTVLNGMRNVVLDPQGTAYVYFKGVTYTLAAKTGTAQVFSLKQNQRYHADMLPENLRDNSLFIVFAPADHPQIAMAVLVQNSSIHVAQLARQVLDFYFSNQNISPPLQKDQMTSPPLKKGG